MALEMLFITAKLNELDLYIETNPLDTKSEN